MNGKFITHAKKEIKALKKEVEELERLLEMSNCPIAGCDNKGAIQVDEDEWEQCQWCDERKKALNQ